MQNIFIKDIWIEIDYKTDILLNKIKWMLGVHDISSSKNIIPCLSKNYCTPPKCGKLSKYTDSAHTEVEDLSSRCMNGSDEYDRCGHDTTQFHPSCSTCRRTANIPRPGWQVMLILSFDPKSPFFSHLSFNIYSFRWEARCSSVIERSLMVWWVVGSILHGVDPLSYFSFQPMLHDWSNKGCGRCYPVCGMVHIKEPLLLIRKSGPRSSRFPFSLSEWSFTICLTPYNRK